MTNFEHLKSLSIQQLAEWLDAYEQFDNSPWSDWFNKTYCDKCESIKCKYADAEEKLGFSPFTGHNGEIECSCCELENKCRFFQDLDDIPDNRKIIELWLIEEADK